MRLNNPRVCRALAGIAFAAVLLCASCGLPTSAAFADDDSKSSAAASAAAEKPDYSSLSLEELKNLVQELTGKRDEAQARLADLDARRESTGKQLSAAEEKLASAQALADSAVVERYKTQRHGAGLVDAVLAAPDFNELVEQVAYVERIAEVDLGALRTSRNEVKALGLKKKMIEFEHSSVEKRLEALSANLEQATAARDEAQRKADLVANAHLTPDGADWGAGEEKFIEVWAPRIDAYFAEAPLAGQGKTFAKAAWANHVDPRFSPAISNIESSKGRICIRPYNAWGWGAADSDPYGLASEWGSWEEAINAHVKGLARGYGYTISEGGAQSYCPGNWEEWYATTVAQMNSI